MKLKKLYEKIYKAVFSLPVLRKLPEKLPWIEKLLQWEFVSYVLFGLLTTAVNLAAYWLANLPWGDAAETKVLFNMPLPGENTLPFRWIYAANAIAWIAAVTFSFVVNKLLVFESRETDGKTLLREVVSFFGMRIASFLLFEELLFGVLAHFMYSWFAKLIVAVFVVVFNFIASKLLIFRKKKPEEEPQA
jgi:putative flippase GtrA